MRILIAFCLLTAIIVAIVCLVGDSTVALEAADQKRLNDRLDKIEEALNISRLNP